MKLYFVDNMLFTESNQEIMMRLSYLLKVRKAHHLFLNGKLDLEMEKVLKGHEKCNLYTECDYHIEDVHVVISDDLVHVDGIEATLDTESVLIYDTEQKCYTRIYLSLFLNHSIAEQFIDCFVKELEEALQDKLANVTVKKIK